MTHLAATHGAQTTSTWSEYSSYMVKMEDYHSVLECSAAASPADKLLEHRSVDLPEGSSLSHLSQVVYTKPETKLFQVLEKDR